MAGKNSKKKIKKTMRGKYPPLYFIGTTPIRIYNIISLYVGEVNMKKLVEIATKNEGLSVAKILAISGTPCSCCKNEPVVYMHKGKEVRIPRGLLSLNKSESGSTITKKKRNGL